MSDNEFAASIATHATRFSVPDSEVVVEYTGITGWAVRTLFGDCLTQNGKWSFEPMPSARSEAFFKRHRFRTLESAWLAAVAAVEKDREEARGEA